jgi:hypothetical protein
VQIWSSSVCNFIYLFLVSPLHTSISLIKWTAKHTLPNSWFLVFLVLLQQVASFCAISFKVIWLRTGNMLAWRGYRLGECIVGGYSLHSLVSVNIFHNYQHRRRNSFIPACKCLHWDNGGGKWRMNSIGYHNLKDISTMLRCSVQNLKKY